MITKTRTTMKMKDFFTITTCPGQRSTETRAPRVSKQHLANAHEAQYDVAIGILDNVVYKIDGHTRSFLWENEKLPILTDTLDVAVWHVDTLDELLSVYKTYDNKSAAETSNDVISGLFRLNAITPSKSWKNPFSLTTALKLAYGILYPNNNITAPNAVEHLKPSVQIINNSNIGSARPEAGILAAMYILVDRDGESAIEFFKKFMSNDGKKANKKMDAVQALIDTVAYLKTQQKHSETKNHIFCKYTLSAYEAYLGNKVYSTNSIVKDYKTKLQLANFEDYTKKNDNK